MRLSIHPSRIPVNKGINSRVGWTKHSDLYEIVYPRSLDLISSCLLTGAECGKGQLIVSSMHIGLDQSCVELRDCFEDAIAFFIGESAASKWIIETLKFEDEDEI